MPRLTKIYTRKGDEGFTSIRNQQLGKDDLLIEAVGAVDELNAAIGMVVTSPNIPSDVNSVLIQVQNDLFDIGAELHVPARQVITDEKISWLEQRLDHWNDNLPALQEFILPGGNISSASAHLARTICRRAERDMVRLHHQASLTNSGLLRYLNRLSDLLFVVARVLARTTDQHERMWQS